METNNDLIEQFLAKTNKTKNKNAKCINVAVAGLPNAGKSTITNALVGEKVSIITPKAQTTRDVIRGIFAEGDTQVILIDTPGVFIPKKDRLLERKIVKNAWNGIQDADVVCVIIDSEKGITEKVRTLINDITKKQDKIIFVLHQVNSIRKEKLFALAKELEEIYPKYMELFMVSATKGDNLNKLKEYLISLAPKRQWVFNEDEITDAPMKFLASEITREQLFLTLREDLPYSVDVYTEKWEDFDNGDIKIQQVIRVLKDSQKAIILGKNGSKLKTVSINARKEMEEFFQRKVHLFLFVKVDTKWIEDR